jgi:2-keto-4-pentenoate hydratase/2-oxohepta-3-ene-1,7-dioic acid hydratase in catechol pathway
VKLVSYRCERGVRAGVLRDGRVLDAWDALDPGGTRSSVRELLRDGALEELPAALAGDGRPLAEVALEVPLPDPDKIVCIGLNYRAHAEEGGREAPETPAFFAKFATSLRPAGATVELPHWSSKVDYEAEVAFVIGKAGKDIAAADALEHVAGYSLLNDLSARDYQFKTPQWMPGKTFDGSAPCGPALVTPDEAGAHDAIEFELRLNGEVMQRASTAELVHSVPALVAYLSMLMTLEPGDVVATGTPAGVGSLRDPKVWLAPGDEVEIRSPTLGVLATRLG